MLRIVRWLDMGRAQYPPHNFDAIFFEASGTKSFTSSEVRDAFRERWLGLYLRVYSEWVYLAIDDAGSLQGYLLGSLDDPAVTPLFSDIGYFQNMAALTARFPGQLHVNLAPVARGQGVGSRLVTAFAEGAVEAGCKGLHVVTGRTMRNVGFYERNGFAKQNLFDWQGRELVFLGRVLDAGL